jgi:hypothetical protein
VGPGAVGGLIFGEPVERAVDGGFDVGRDGLVLGNGAAGEQDHEQG